MSSAAQVLRQAESLKASLVENGRVTSEGGKSPLEGGKTISEGGKGLSDLWVTRQKLEDVYKRLLLMDLEYALDKKVEQDLWNHAFKNQITALQTQIKEKHASNPKKAEVQANLNLFLETASGFYLQFLQLICSTFKLDLPFRRKSSAFGVMKEKTQLRARITPPKRSSCLYICQYCLVHLGDIARYRQQVEQAQTYYRHAVNLSPQNGQPYNQLAILEVNRNNKLSSVFYYVRSLALKSPFPVAATNLEKFYSKLIKDTSEFKGKMAQNEFVNAFLQFQALLHLAADFSRASYLCSRILACLPALLVSQTFSASVLVQCVAITIFTLNHVRHVPSGGEASATNSPKGEGGGGGEQGRERAASQVEVLLSSDEQKSLDIILAFTASVLELLVQHTPLEPGKARESPTLPAVQVLLDWLCHSPDIITVPPFTNSNIWGHLAKMLNTVQQFEEGKCNLDLTKYEEVPLPEDTELRCFQPIEKAHSKYSFSRIPVDGFPRGVEEQVRCMRLVSQGKIIAEEFPELKMTAIQQNDPPRINFSGPLLMKNTEAVVSSQERRAKQNVAMQDGVLVHWRSIRATPHQSGPSQEGDPRSMPQSSHIIPMRRRGPEAIMKHGQGNPADSQGRVSTKDGSSSEQGSPKYLLGTVTSEPQFMKHGSGGSTNRLQTSPQLSPGFSRRGQSPQARGASPMQGLTSPRVASPRPVSGRVASPLPPQPQPQQQQASLTQASQRKPLQQQQQQQQTMAKPVQQQQQQQPEPSLPQQSAAHSPHGGNLHFQAPPSPVSPPSRNQVPPQNAFLGNLPFQGQVQGLGQSPSQNPHSGPEHLPQGHGPAVRMPQGHGYQGQGSVPGRGMENLLGQQTSPGQGGVSQYQPYSVTYPSLGGDRYHVPHVQALTSQGNVRAQMDTPRMPRPFPSGQPSTSGAPGDAPSLAQSSMASPGPCHASPNLLNHEMMAALRLASQISHPQSDVGMHLPSQQQQDQSPPQAMFRPPIQRPPILGHGPPRGGGVGGGGGAGGIGPSPPSPMGQGPYSTSGLVRSFHPGMNQAQRPPTDMSMHAFSASRPHPHPRMHGAMPPRGHDMGMGQGGSSRLPAPPIPMPGQAGSGFPSLMNTLFPEEGNGGRSDGGRGYQALSPLTIQPPKSSPPDTRISTSFQGHAEGTPKPDKQEKLAPEKSEVEPVIHRVVMPVGQPGGEYSLFASSSPWSMPLNSSSDSKSMASSPLSSQDSSMRNSPIIGFEPQTAAPYNGSSRHKGMQGEGWVSHGQCYEEPKVRGQGQHGAGNNPHMWTEIPKTPLERLLEQQRLQRQTDPH